jgi:hypothetical protein
MMNNATAQPHFQTTPIPRHSDLRNIGGNGISRFDAEEIKEMKEMKKIECKECEGLDELLAGLSFGKSKARCGHCGRTV